MTELLIQSATATSRSKQLAAEAARIKANCAAQHGDNKPLVSCSQCYEALVEAVRTRYLNPDSDSSQGDASTRRQQSQQPEWFTFRRTFLSELDLMLDSVKEYQSSPQAVDDRVREERSRWYAERVRSSLLRLMAEDPSQRGAVFEKLEDQSTLATGGDSVALAEEVAEILKTGPLAVEAGQERIRELPQKLAAATDAAGKVGVLKDILFKAEDGTVPEDHQKYLDMLLNQGLSMEQVVDRILEERQTAIGASQQIDKLKQRLDELRRARAAHEAHKTRKAQRRESLAQQKVPDELYDLPVCAVCGDAPSTKDFYCCSVCTMLTEAGVQPQKTVFCSDKCEQQGYRSHLETHTCASAAHCIQLLPFKPPPPPRPQPQQQQQQSLTTKPPQAGEEDTPMADAPPSPPSSLRFCTECISSLKQPTIWCTLACAAANFQRHRQEMHLPERRKRGLSVDDEGQLEYIRMDTGTGVGGDSSGGGGRRYRAKDIGALTTGFGDAVKEWEGKNRVKLQSTA